MSFKYTSRHHGWYAAQVSHGTTYVVLTLSLLIRPVWPSTYDELVSLSKKKYSHPHHVPAFPCSKEETNSCVETRPPRARSTSGLKAP